MTLNLPYNNIGHRYGMVILKKNKIKIFLGIDQKEIELHSLI